MSKKEQNNQLARAIARWDNEGGATLSARQEDDEHAVLSREEQEILQRLGAAVVTQWAELPIDVQKALFEHAASCGDPLECPNLREQIAVFLHDHKSHP